MGDATTTSTVTEMFLLAPDGPRVLRAQLDEQFVGRVAPGRRAEAMPEHGDGPGHHRARRRPSSPRVRSGA